jgi:hypothetical protein
MDGTKYTDALDSTIGGLADGSSLPIVAGFRSAFRLTVRPDAGSGRWMLCVEHLFVAFIQGVNTYLVNLRADPLELQPKFGSMFVNYGWMQLRPR